MIVLLVQIRKPRTIYTSNNNQPNPKPLIHISLEKSVWLMMGRKNCIENRKHGLASIL